MICIIDYGMGNLHSVFKAFRRVGFDTEVISSPVGIEKYEKIVLPGVGDFKRGMENLNSAGFTEVIKRQVIDRQIPILGICLGMQLLTSFSEEGNAEGLNLIEAKTLHFRNLDTPTEFKIPHMGWNSITGYSSGSLFTGCENSLFYFVHSYAVICKNESDVLCKTNYGITFHSGIRKGNIIGLQFHPEKSHKDGLKILENFSAI